VGDNSGIEYEGHSKEKGRSDYEVSLEVESDVDENIREGDGGPIVS